MHNVSLTDISTAHSGAWSLYDTERAAATTELFFRHAALLPRPGLGRAASCEVFSAAGEAEARGALQRAERGDARGESFREALKFS